MLLQPLYLILFLWKNKSFKNILIYMGEKDHVITAIKPEIIPAEKQKFQVYFDIYGGKTKVSGIF